MPDAHLRLRDFELAGTDLAVTTPRELAVATDLDWIPVDVPGGVHEALTAAGKIEHPFYAESENGLRWIEDRAWWYRARFDNTTTQEEIVFHGVDTVADFWVDGDFLGHHETAFRPAVFDLPPAPNAVRELLVRFTPPLAGLPVPEGPAQMVALMKAYFASLLPADVDPSDIDDSPGVLSANLALTLRRKPTFSWGWDFGPRVPSIGLTDAVEVGRKPATAITGTHIRLESVEAGTALVAVTVEAVGADAAAEVVVTLTGPGGSVVAASATLVSGRADMTLHVPDAQLWWTHDLGSPTRYVATTTLRAVDNAATLDERTELVGLRTVTLDRSPAGDEAGRLFRFLLNDVPIFARGANWVPVSSLIGSATPERTRGLVELAKDGNMNMIRVWGGGTYERDGFYDTCDELGILVWQDFMFACVDYPSDDPTLHAEVTREAEFQVRRLRNHPSVGIWAGNNEIHAIHHAVYQNTDPGPWGWDFFHDVLPTAVANHSPGTLYWPGSPWAEDDPRGMNGVLDGDRHAWEVWHGMDVGAGGPQEFATPGEQVHFHRYANDKGKFISEFGIHASPELGTLERWTTPGSLGLHSPSFDHRNKDKPKNKGDDLMEFETGLPSDLGSYIDYSMACQAEGLKFGIEHYRRRQPVNSGTLVWQYNDVWPGFSWSVVDYDLVPKAGYWFLQRVFAPVIASYLLTPDNTLELWVCNNSAGPANLTLDLDVTTFAGKEILADTVEVTVAPAMSRRVWTAASRLVDPGADRFAWVSERDRAVPENRLFFAPVKSLELTDGGIEASVTRHGDGRATVELTAADYAYFARVNTPAPGTRFSTNYVDLRPGRPVTVEIEGLPAGFDPAALGIATFGPKKVVLADG